MKLFSSFSLLAVSASFFVLAATAYPNGFKAGPSEDELASRGQCYSYLDETISLSESLGPCKIFCPETEIHGLVRPRLSKRDRVVCEYADQISIGQVYRPEK